MTGTRVVIVGNDMKYVKYIEELLKQMGLVVVGQTNDPFGSLKVIGSIQPDLVIIDGHYSFMEVAKTVDDNISSALLLLTDIRFLETEGSIVEQWGFTNVLKPVNMERLKLKIAIALEKYSNSLNSIYEERRLNHGGTTRNIVAKAKKILATNLGISETEALNKIIILSHRQNASVREEASKIVKSGRYGSLYQLRGII